MRWQGFGHRRPEVWSISDPVALKEPTVASLGLCALNSGYEAVIHPRNFKRLSALKARLPTPISKIYRTV